jgi:hypothetical protein
MMKRLHIVILLAGFIVALSLVAAGTGVLWQGGSHTDFTTLRGQTVQIWGGGLYKFDSVSGASQEIGQDLVTLFIGIPLLVVASILALRGSIRGKVLLAGTLGYFLYTYTSMAMMTAYNQFFLVYVALMSLSLFAFVPALMELHASDLPAHLSAGFPRRIIAGYSIFIGMVLILLWTGLVVPSLLAGTTPNGLDGYSTMVIQAMDLGLLAPTAIMTGVLLFRKSPYGYLFSSAVLVLGFTLGAALLAMGFGQVLAGAQVDPVALVMFAILAITDMVLTVLLFRSIVNVPVAQQEVAEEGQSQAELARASGEYLASSPKSRDGRQLRVVK